MEHETYDQERDRISQSLQKAIEKKKRFLERFNKAVAERLRNGYTDWGLTRYFETFVDAKEIGVSDTEFYEKIFTKIINDKKLFPQFLKHISNYVVTVTAHDRLFETQRFFNDLKEGKVLDLGISTGETTSDLAEYFRGKDANVDVKGIDIKPELLTKGRQQGSEKPEFQPSSKEPEFAAADVRRLPFKDNSFEGIRMMHVMQYLHEDAKKEAMKELERVLKENGIAVVGHIDDFNIYRKKRGRLVLKKLVKSREVL